MAFSRNSIHIWILSLAITILVWLSSPAIALANQQPDSAGTPTHIPTGDAVAPSSVTTIAGPLVPLTLYQQRWVQDDSRLKIGMMSRQSGKSFGTALEAVIDCFKRKTTWVFLSAGERQSKELMAKAAMHAKAMNLAILEISDTFKDENDVRTEYKQLEIIFPNGSRIIGLPANPATARGHSANILLDEFGLHKDSRAIWTALYPSITRGYKIRVISTPLGKKNKFYEIWTGLTLQIWDGLDYKHVGDKGGWSKHKVTIYDAVAMGLELYDDDFNITTDPEYLRLGLGDDEAWHQEYLCEFIDESSAWLTYDLIETVEDVRLDASPVWLVDLISEAVKYHEQWKAVEHPPVTFEAGHILDRAMIAGDLYAGFDVARHRDMSLIWLDEIVGEVARCRGVANLTKQPFGVQKLVLFTLLKHPKMRRCCIDQTGLGAQMAEEAVTLFGSRAEGVTFSNASKEALAVGIKRSFENGKDAIPTDTTIRLSLHTVKKIATPAGNFRFDADRDENIGHADHFWAKALAVEARGTAVAPVNLVSRSRRTAQTLLEGYA
ncbi:MAG: terminase family protein [Desulfuromonadaceae bacterium]